MTVLLISAILLALGAIFFFSAARLRKYAPGREALGMPAVVLSLWLVATVVWGRPFLEIKIPGFFDVTLDRILLITIILYLFAGLYTGRISFRKNAGIELAMFAFILVCLVSMTGQGFLPELPSFPSPWNNFINGYIFPFIAFLFAKYYIQRPRDMRFVFNTLFLLGAYLAVTSFFEFFNMRAFVFPRYISNPEILIHIDRARGPFLNAAFNGAAITMGFICGLHLLPEKKGFGLALRLGLLGLSFPAIFFTQTRSAYLGFLITLVLFLSFYRTSFPKWKALALPVALFLTFMLANIPRITSEDRRQGGVVQTYELEIRLALIKRSMSIAAMAPFFGVGLGQFLPVSTRNFPGEVSSQSFNEELQHFHILGLLAELGIAGAALYLTLIVLVFRRLSQLKRLLPKTGFVSGNLVLALTAVWVVHLTTNLFLEPSYCLFFNAVPFTCAGLADGIHARSA